MSDVLFRYLLAARRRGRSLKQRLLLADELLLAAGVEQLVESAAARVQVTSQHERIERVEVERPASHRQRVRFARKASPDRPAAGEFRRRDQEFPLEKTLKLLDCPKCRKRGQVRCGSCFGRGTASALESSVVRRCPNCGGDGNLVCRRCGGEGRLAQWVTEIYSWRVAERRGEVAPLPDPPPGLLAAIDRGLDGEPLFPDPAASLEPAAVAEHLGYESPETLDVAARAGRLYRRLETQARGAKERYLFHRTEVALIPVGYTVVRLDSAAAGIYWLVGRGETAQEVLPSGWRLTLGGALRRLRRLPRVETVGLLPASGEPTPALICYAYLGSYSGRLKVLDRAYDAQLLRLLGRPRPPRQSASLTVELAGGRRIRLVEVAQPHRLSRAQLLSMAEALDGVLILREHGPAGPSAGELEDRLRSAAAGASAEARPAICEVVIDRDAADLAACDDAAAGFERGLPFEALRRAFVERLLEERDWGILFDRIWRPVDELLASRSEVS